MFHPDSIYPCIFRLVQNRAHSASEQLSASFRPLRCPSTRDQWFYFTSAPARHPQTFTVLESVDYNSRTVVGRSADKVFGARTQVGQILSESAPRALRVIHATPGGHRPRSSAFPRPARPARPRSRERAHRARRSHTRAPSVAERAPGHPARAAGPAYAFGTRESFEGDPQDSIDLTLVLFLLARRRARRELRDDARRRGEHPRRRQRVRARRRARHADDAARAEHEQHAWERARRAPVVP